MQNFDIENFRDTKENELMLIIINFKHHQIYGNKTARVKPLNIGVFISATCIMIIENPIVDL